MQEYDYIYAGSQLVYMTISTTVDGGTATTDKLYFTYDANGIPYSMEYNGTVYYYITNLQGDVISIVNTSGTVAASYEYDPYGNVVSATGDMAEINPLRYRGYVYDTESTLYYLQSRYYDPAIGRFINADSLASTGQGILGNNMFAYCLNNPVSYCDPSGSIAIVDDVLVALTLVYGFSILTIIMSPPFQQLLSDFVMGIITSIDMLIQEVGHILEAKGKQNIRDSGLKNLSDQEVLEKQHDPNLSSSERKRYQKEAKGRGLRNKGKRKNIYRIWVE